MSIALLLLMLDATLSMKMVMWTQGDNVDPHLGGVQHDPQLLLLHSISNQANHSHHFLCESLNISKSLLEFWGPKVIIHFLHASHNAKLRSFQVLFISRFLIFYELCLLTIWNLIDKSFVLCFSLLFSRYTTYWQSSPSWQIISILLSWSASRQRSRNEPQSSSYQSWLLTANHTSANCKP